MYTEVTVYNILVLDQITAVFEAIQYPGNVV